MNILKFNFKFRQYFESCILANPSKDHIFFSDLLDCFTQWDSQGALNASRAPCPLNVKAVNNHATHCNNAEDLKPEPVMTFIQTGAPV